MKSLHKLLALAALLPQASSAQTDISLLAFTVPQGIDVQRDLDVEYGAAETGNAAKLTAAFANTTHQKSFLFFGGRCEFNDAPVRIPARYGYVFAGGGLSSIVNEGATTAGPSPRLIQAVPRVSFNSNGSSVTATTSGSSATITISGRAVVNADAGRTLHVTGGTNYILDSAEGSWYSVESVSTGANTWTLDRVCSSGNGSGMVGMATETLWHDRSAGSIYTGLGFRGNVKPNPQDAEPDPPLKTHIGLHRYTQPDFSFPNGKTSISHCSFSDFTAAILTATDLRKAYCDNADYFGHDGSFGDKLMTYKNRFANCKAAIHVRARQAVGHVLIGDQFGRCEDCYYFERGGGASIYDATVGGPSPRILRIGRGNSNSGDYTMIGCDFDGATSNPQFVGMDNNSTTTLSLYAAGLWLDNKISSFNRPLFDLKTGMRATIVNCNRMRPGSVKLTAAAGARPLVFLQMCSFESAGGGALAEASFGTIVDNSSSADCYVYFSACTSGGQSSAFDGKYRTGTGFVAMNDTERWQARMVAKLCESGTSPTLAHDWFSSPECLEMFLPDTARTMLAAARHAPSDPLLALAP